MAIKLDEARIRLLKITDTEGNRHISFSRSSYNYIAAPSNGVIGLIANDTLSGAGCAMVIATTSAYPGTTNTVSLGTSSYKWKNVYATTFTGDLSGNAATATKATQDGDGNVIKNTYLKLAGGTMTGSLQIGNSSTSATTADAVGIVVRDLRAVSMAPSTLGDRTAVFYFDEAGPSGDTGWKGILRVKGWTGSYTAWELAGPANSTDTKEFYVRSGLGGGSWGAWRKLLTSDNYTSYTVTKTGSGASGDSWAISITGNAATATTASKTQAALSLNGKSFNGSAAVDMGTLGIAYGGTGATTAASALTNFGLTATATELNYCDGVTSNIQTQLNAKLPKSGGTMTGALTLKGNAYSYHTDSTSYCLNAANSDIIGVNGIYFSDNCDGMTEGIHFYRTATTWDTISASGGTFYFASNHDKDQTTLVGNAELRAGTLTSTNATGIRLAYSSYGVMFRNDGDAFWILLTNKDDPMGNWTDARPLSISLSTGLCNINGNAATATKLGTSTIGATDRPIYLNSGTATQTTYRMAATNATATTARAITENLETGIWYVSSTSDILSQSDGVAYVNKYNDSWIAEIYQDYRTGQIAVRGKNNGTWQAWRKILDSSNYSSYALPLSGGTLSGTLKWSNALTNVASPTVVATFIGNDSANGLGFSYTSALSVGSASRLLSSNAFPSASGIQYCSGSMTKGTSPGQAFEGSSPGWAIWSYPAGGTWTNDTVANIQTLRLFWGDTYFTDIYTSPNVAKLWTRAVQNGAAGAWRQIWTSGDSITGAVWNDYAEYRESDCSEPGRVLIEKGDDTLTMSTEHMQPFAGIVSDTWGFCQGETETAKTPIAVAGRVLVYTNQDRNTFKPGDVVCAGPNGTVEKMSRNEIIQFPDRIVGTVSCVPEYETWGSGDRDPVQVNGRIWIKVR